MSDTQEQHQNPLLSKTAMSTPSISKYGLSQEIESGRLVVGDRMGQRMRSKSWTTGEDISPYPQERQAHEYLMNTEVRNIVRPQKRDSAFSASCDAGTGDDT